MKVYSLSIITDFARANILSTLLRRFQTSSMVDPLTFLWMAISESQRVQAMRKGKSSLIFVPPSSVMSLVARRLKVAQMK